MDAKVEITQEERARRRQVLTDSELFVSLMKHAAWPRFAALVESVAQNHHAAVMKPVDSILECARTEFHKGVLSGLSAAIALPQLKINEANELRPRSEEE